MKRFLVSILAVLCLVANTGFALHEHYCMGERVDASLVAHEAESHRCRVCGMEKKAGNGCCESKHKVIKGKQDHAVAAAHKAFLKTIAEAVVPPVFHPLAAPSFAYRAETDLVRLQLPPPDRVPIFLRVRSLRI